MRRNQADSVTVEELLTALEGEDPAALAGQDGAAAALVAAEEQLRTMAEAHVRGADRAYRLLVRVRSLAIRVRDADPARYTPVAAAAAPAPSMNAHEGPSAGGEQVSPRPPRADGPRLSGGDR